MFDPSFFKTRAYRHWCDRAKFLTLFTPYAAILLFAFPVLASQLAANFSGNGTLQNSLSLSSMSSFTVEFWMRSDSFSQQSTVVYVGPDTSSGFGLGLSSTLVPGRESYGTLLLGGVSLIATGNSFRVPIHQWIHVAITRSPTEWKLYRNGALVGRTASGGIGPNVNLIIGNGFYGAITRLRIWSRGLDRSDLVRSMCSLAIPDSNLLAEYTPVASGALDSLPDILGISAPLQATGTVIATGDSNFPNYGPPPGVTLFSFPSHMQFFARDRDDSSRILISGSMTPVAGDSMLLELSKNDSLIDLTELPATSRFQFEVPIHCELSQYTIRLFVERAGNNLFVSEGGDLLSGDVFLIDGQSNAHPTIDGYSWQNVFSRTIGLQTTTENLDPYDPADTLWGLSFATGHGQLFSGPYLVGSWARWMQEGIANEWNVPTCVINGAAGASTIDQHVRRDDEPTDSTTIYGRLLYRTLESGLAHKVKVIFWYQGEWDSGYSYLASFRKIYNDWSSDYSRDDSTPVEHFIVQTRPNNCGFGDGLAREPQREIQDSFPNCSSLSTVALEGYSGCHYFWNGYEAIGQEVLRKIGKYLYNSLDTIDVDPPDIFDAHYVNQSHLEIAIRFRTPIAGLVATPGTVVDGVNRRIADAFYLDGESGMIDSVEFSKDTIFLLLKGSSTAKTVSYVPVETYDDDTTVYSGPWIVNTAGVGALTFYQYPIGEAVIQDVYSGSKASSSIKVLENSGEDRPELLVNLGEAGWARIELMDVLGRETATVADTWMDAGEHIIPINFVLPEKCQFASFFTDDEALVVKLFSIH